jgi:hypothetical protein
MRRGLNKATVYEIQLTCGLELGTFPHAMWGFIQLNISEVNSVEAAELRNG